MESIAAVALSPASERHQLPRPEWPEETGRRLGRVTRGVSRRLATRANLRFAGHRWSRKTMGANERAGITKPFFVGPLLPISATPKRLARDSRLERPRRDSRFRRAELGRSRNSTANFLSEFVNSAPATSRAPSSPRIGDCLHGILAALNPLVLRA